MHSWFVDLGTWGRPDSQMRDLVDATLRQLENIGRHQAAATMYRAGVPLRVIGRVLDERGRRRR